MSLRGALLRVSWEVASWQCSFQQVHQTGMGLRSAWDGERRKSGSKVSSSGRRALTVVLRFRLMQKCCCYSCA